MTSMNISLPEPLRLFVREQVSKGGYSTASEYLGSLIREAQRRADQHELEAMLQAGMQSPTCDENFIVHLQRVAFRGSSDKQRAQWSTLAQELGAYGSAKASTNRRNVLCSVVMARRRPSREAVLASPASPR
jgi:putative addiction module CopG family antidote